MEMPKCDICKQIASYHYECEQEGFFCGQCINDDYLETGTEVVEYYTGKICYVTNERGGLRDTVRTKVIFKKLKGEIIALFPEIEEGKDMILSYMHLGQHGPASRNLLKLRNATKAESQQLRDELCFIGYKLVERGES